MSLVGDFPIVQPARGLGVAMLPNQLRFLHGFKHGQTDVNLSPGFLVILSPVFFVCHLPQPVADGQAHQNPPLPWSKDNHLLNSPTAGPPRARFVQQMRSLAGSKE
jgi:hypothetical protein